MRRYINYLIIFLFGLFLLAPSMVNADGTRYYQEYSKYTNSKKDGICDKAKTDISCAKAGCKWDSTNNECIPYACDENRNCSDLSYCVPRESKRGDVGTATCYKKDDCGWYNRNSTNCVSMDDFGTTCDTSKCSTMQGNADIISASFNYTNGGDNIRACSSYLDLMKRGVAPAAGAANDKVCDEYGKKMTATPWVVNGAVYTCKHTPSYKYYYELSCSNMGKTTCPDGKVAYYQYRVSGSVYICGDPVFGGDSTGGGGGGRRQCRDNFGYVENALTQNCDPDRDDSCEVSACTDVSTEQVETIDTGAKYGNTGYEFIRYRGTCDGATYDAFCIDPGISFSSSGYGCQATMNDENAIDKAFAKIYQTSLEKNYYYDDYRSGITSAGKYKALHIAFRLLTAYKRIMHNSNMALAAAFEHSADRYINISAPLIDPYFMVKVNNKLADDNDENWGSAKDIDFVNGVKIFKAAVAGDPWLNPMKFELRSQWKGQSGAELDVALVNTSGLKQNNLYADESWAQGIYCNGCQILSVPSGNLADISEAIIRVRTTASTFTIGVKYYDRRDRKNMVIATKDQSASYQRLALTNIEAIRVNSNRAFLLERTFEGSSRSCDIINGKYYDKSGIQTDKSTFLNQCCGFMNSDREGLYKRFCDTLNRNSEEYRAACTDDYRELWFKDNQCNLPCDSNTTNPKSGECDELEGEKIVISDLTDDESLGMTGRYVDSDHYCLSCVGQNNSTDVTGSSYLRINNNYCQVYCIEEYTFGVPGHLKTIYNGKTIDYGRYLDLKVPATAKRICYTDPVNKINYQQFYSDIKALERDIKNEINTLNSLKRAYESAKAAYDNGDAFNPTQEGICTESEPYQDCPKGYWWPGGNSSAGICHSDKRDVCGCGPNTTNCFCTASPEDKTRTVNCSGDPRPTSYSYSTGGYSHSSTGSCNGCSTSNGSREGVLSGFKADYDNQFNKVKGLIETYKATVNSYNSCYDFDTGLCIDGSKDSNPYIEYTYEETYYMEVLGNNAKLAGKWSTKESTEKYYNNVNTANGMCSFAASSVEAEKYSTEKFTTFEVKDGSVNIKDNDFAVQNNHYTYKTMTKQAELKPIVTWYTKIGDGHATLKQEPNTIPLGNPSGNVLPISRICLDRAEKFTYTLSFKQVGQEINQCSTGRLNKIIGITDTDPSSNRANAKYICDYTVKDKGCEGCENTYYFRPISLTDVFPKSGKAIAELAARNSLFHSDISVKDEKLPNERSVPSVWATAKGKKAQEQIEQIGEKAYTKEHLEYSYTLTPAGMKQIRAYNEDKNYGDFNMNCGGDWYCSSNFLDEIEQNKYSGVKQNTRKPNYDKYNGTEVWR